jgi:hypothetical protein
MYYTFFFHAAAKPTREKLFAGLFVEQVSLGVVDLFIYLFRIVSFFCPFTIMGSPCPDGVENPADF